MTAHRSRFLELALHCDALRFGDFPLKSGRDSPYFFNAGQFHSGSALAGLAECYAEALLAHGLEFDMLFGPAYKGIPLVALTAAALVEHHGIDVPFCFNRKEVKAHGEGGAIVGAPVAGRVLILDDVITAGTAIRESLDIIRAAGGEPAGVILALDRQERGQGPRSAVQEVAAEFGLQCVSILTLAELIEAVSGGAGDGLRISDDELAALQRYRQTYGIG